MDRNATPDPGEVRVVAFDLDGTLLRGGTACEVLARPIGRLARVREMEASSSTEQMAAARTEMAGWYQDYSRSELLGFLDQAELAPGAEDGCRQLREAGVEIVIVSLTWSFAVEAFAHRFGASAWLGTTLESDGSISHVWPEDKPRWLEEQCAATNTRALGVAAVGDSLGDVPLLNSVGLPIFVGKTLLKGLPAETVHLPDADIRDVAQLILNRALPSRHSQLVRVEQGSKAAP